MPEVTSRIRDQRDGEATAGLEDNYTVWARRTMSRKALMSVRDADLYEALLHRLATRRDREALRVIEWGDGRSTIWYTHILESLGLPFQWVTIEHDGQYFQRHVLPYLPTRPRLV